MYIVKKAVESKCAVEFSAKWRNVEHQARVEYCCKIKAEKFLIQISNSKSVFICYLDGRVETKNAHYVGKGEYTYA